MQANTATLVEAALAQGLRARDHNNLGEARELFETALAQARASGDIHDQVKALLELIRTAEILGHSVVLREFAAQCLLLTSSSSLEMDRARCLFSLGNMALQENEVNEAQGHLSAALGIAEKTGDRVLPGMILHQLGRVCERTGAIEMAVDYWRRSLAEAEAIGDIALVINSLLNLGYAHTEYLWEPVPGKALFERAAELAGQQGWTNLVTRAQRGLALTARNSDFLTEHPGAIQYRASGLSITTDGAVFLEAIDLTGQPVPAAFLVTFSSDQPLPSIELRGLSRLSFGFRPAPGAAENAVINSRIEYIPSKPTPVFSQPTTTE